MTSQIVSIAAFACLSIAAATASQAENNPAPLSNDTRALTWKGVTLYGNVDLGIQHQTHGAPASDYIAYSTEPVIQKIVQGKMEKFYEETCLYEQHFIKDETVTIGEKITQAIAKLGENITIRRFSRFKVGEVPNQLAAPVASRHTHAYSHIPYLLRECRKDHSVRPPTTTTTTTTLPASAAGAFIEAP